MNQMVPADRMTAIEQKINTQVSSAIAVGTGGISFQNAGEVMEYAKMMAVSGSAVPKHLRGQPGACLGIIDDAIRFQTSPYALARKSYFVNDNLAYEAQVLAGIVNAHAPLKQRPQIAYEGDGADRICIVTGEFKDGAVRDYRSPRIGSITPKNSPLWKNDPDQQLAYYSLRGFARRHCPEILLGIYDVEEMRSIDHSDDEPRPSLADRLASARAATGEAADTREGFDASFVARETQGLSAGQEPTNHEPASTESSSPSVETVGSEPEQDVPLSSDVASTPAGEPVEAGAEGQEQSEPAPVSELDGAARNLMEECRDKFIQTAVRGDLSTDARREHVRRVREAFSAELPDHLDFIARCVEATGRIVANPSTAETEREYLGRLIK